ncbi:MAG TPA: hypothetical protein VH593_01890 [Ktedonobacteraceae bacterium]|jgi:hypothetical protein
MSDRWVDVAKGIAVISLAVLFAIVLIAAGLRAALWIIGWR